MTRRRDDERGMALVNTLAVVAVGAAAVLLMTTAHDASVDRALSGRQAAQARAYIRGGELSAVTALRRDMLEAPSTDHLAEPWATVIQDEVAVEGGRFSLTVTDEQARFNLNSLARGGLAAQAPLERLVLEAGLPREAALRIAAYIGAIGPISDLTELSPAGLDAEGQARLAEVAVALPGEAPVNVNTAGPEVLSALIGDPVAARLLIGRRDARGGHLRPEDVSGAGVILPPGLGFTSSHYRVETQATVGDTVQRGVSRLQRRRGSGGRPEVVVWSRRRVPGAPGPANP